MTMSVDQAMKEVMAEMMALTPQQLRAELDKHKDGLLATALREAGEFLYNYDPDNPQGNAMTATHLFAFDYNDLYHDLEDLQVDGQPALCAFWIADKAYYEANDHLKCQHVSAAAGGNLNFPADKFDEIQESVLISNMNEADTRTWLESQGFVFSEKLQAIFKDG